MKQKFLVLAACLMMGGSAMAQTWEWKNEASADGTGVSGNSYYLYAEVDGLESAFLNAKDGFDKDPVVLWTVSGNFPGVVDKNGFQLTSSSATNFCVRYPFYGRQATTSGNGSNDDDRTLTANFDEGTQTFSMCRTKKYTFYQRNIEVTKNGLTSEAQKNATSCWKFISPNQVDVSTSYINAYKQAEAFNPEAIEDDCKTANIDDAAEKIEKLLAVAHEGITEGATMPSLVGKWVANSGDGPKQIDNGFYETYNGDQTNFPVGKTLYWHMNGLANGFYEVSFYANIQFANWKETGVDAGDGIARVFVNDIEEDIFVPTDQKQVKADEAYTFVVEITDGTLEYGVKNVAEGGNWAWVDPQSLTFLGDTRVDMNISAVGYTTFCSPFAITLEDDVTAYKVEVSPENFSCELVYNAGEELPANTPVLISGSVNKYSYIGKALEGEAKLGNLVGTNEQISLTSTSDSYKYLLQNNNGELGFYVCDPHKDYKLAANRCYLQVNKDEAANVKAFMLNGDIETAIREVANKPQTDVIYDLNGRKATLEKKGVYVVNGKKVVR